MRAIASFFAAQALETQKTNDFNPEKHSPQQHHTKNKRYLTTAPQLKFSLTATSYFGCPRAKKLSVRVCLPVVGLRNNKLLRPRQGRARRLYCISRPCCRRRHARLWFRDGRSRRRRYRCLERSGGLARPSSLGHGSAGKVCLLTGSARDAGKPGSEGGRAIKTKTKNGVGCGCGVEQAKQYRKVNCWCCMIVRVFLVTCATSGAPGGFD